jgi:nicotinamide-nucleotide adenylyltransferase
LAVAVALIIGRFQPLHWGHVKLIEWVRSEGDEAHLGIGSSQFDHTRENPFTADERRRMVEVADEAHGLKVARVDEVPDIFDDTRWVSHVESCCGKFDHIFSHNEWTARLFAEAGYEVRAAPMFDRPLLEGTKIRLAIKEQGLEAVAEAVPPAVLAYLRSLDAEKRIRASWANATPARR